MDKILSALQGNTRCEPLTPPNEAGFFYYRMWLHTERADVVSVAPRELASESGVPSESIVGACTELLLPGERVTPESFEPNPRFSELLHEVVAEHAADLPGIRAEARRQGEGWVYVIDGRTATPGGEVPPHDVVGALEVKGGAVVPGSYRANAGHRLLSSDGFFRLEPELRRRLVERATRTGGG